MTHLILAGFMGTGKSTVGRLLAQRQRLPFIDCDSAIEDAAGTSIPEIFATEGEAAFRTLETEVLTRVLKGESSVVALGGGACTATAYRSGPTSVTCARHATRSAPRAPTSQRSGAESSVDDGHHV